MPLIMPQDDEQVPLVCRCQCASDSSLALCAGEDDKRALFARRFFYGCHSLLVILGDCGRGGG